MLHYWATVALAAILAGWFFWAVAGWFWWAALCVSIAIVAIGFLGAIAAGNPSGAGDVHRRKDGER